MPAMDSVSAEAQELHRRSIVIDAASFFLHGYNDVVAEGGITAVCLTTPMPWEDLATTIRRTEDYYQLVRDDPRLLLVERAADIQRAKAEDKVGIILWAQGLDMIRDRLAHLETMFRLGYRVLQLTYSDRNFIGDGCIEDSDVGLSRFGRSVVKELNRLGIVVDVSHAGARTALDAAELTEKPMIVSHANPRSLYNHPRNIKDELIRTVADKGGVIGVTSYALLNWNGDASHQPTLDDLVAGIDYVVEMVGIEHVGLGTDSEATEGAYPKEVTAELGRRHGSLSKAFKAALGDRTRMADFRGMRDLPLLTDRLLQRGYKPDDVAKVLGQNWLRIYETVWPA